MTFSFYKPIMLSAVVKNLYVPVALMVIFVLSSSYGGNVFAENENYLRSSNKRLWSIITNKQPVESSYSVENVRESAPKQELLIPPPTKKKYKPTPANKLLKLLEAPPDHA